MTTIVKMMNDRSRIDVAVVGAGISGLVAARRLVRAGRSVLVLEADDRAGGRTVNLELGDGKVVEGGGQWVGPTQTAVLALLGELGLETFPTYDTGRGVFFVDGRRRRFRGAVPPVGPVALAQLGLAQLRLDRMARQVPLHAPWTARRADEWDSMTLQTWMDRRVRHPQAQRVLDVVFGATLGAPPRSASLLHVLHFIHSAGGFAALNDTRGGAQDRRVVGGSQRIALRLAEDLGDEHVLLERPVRRIDQRGEDVLVHAGDETIAAGAVVVTTRVDDAGRIELLPAKPVRRRMLERNWATGTGWKAFCVYDTPFWRDEGLSGFVVSDRPGAPLVFDNSPPEGAPGVLLTFRAAYGDGVPGGNAEADLQDAGARRASMVAALADALGPRAGQPIAYLEQDWTAQPWTAGCESPRPPGLITQFRGAEREPIGRVHFAGTDTSDVWAGYMDGAVRAGERVARELLAAVAAQPGAGSAAPEAAV